MHLLNLLLILCQLNLVYCGWKNPFRKNKCDRHAGTSSYPGTIKSGAKGIGIVTGNGAKDNVFKCSAEQANGIANTIKNMHEYAAVATSFLSQPGAERSAAYVAWFGQDNINPYSKAKIQSIFRNIYDLGSTSKRNLKDNDRFVDTIGVACQTTHHVSRCKDHGVVAYAEPEDGRVFICPLAFFNNGHHLSDEAERAARSLWAESRKFQPTGGLYLLHEMTHLEAISGICPTKDYNYKAPECVHLNDYESIYNAQNYVLFALEVKTNPTNARKQVNWNANDKRKDAIEKLRAGVNGKLET
ncbi:zincin [Colletotrichum falcatum]|nr:zincin [Colletotrichum falcatum]